MQLQMLPKWWYERKRPAFCGHRSPAVTREWTSPSGVQFREYRCNVCPGREIWTEATKLPGKWRE